MTVKIIKWTLGLGLFLFLAVPALAFWLVVATKVAVPYDNDGTFDRIAAEIAAGDTRLGDGVDALKDQIEDR
jgi:hypothetical protein